MLLIVIACGAADSRAEPGDAVTASPLQQLAGGLRKTPRAVRSEFAVIALREMIAMYRDELRSAESAAGAHSRWTRGVAAFADRLQADAGRIAPGTPVALLSGPGGEVYMEVQGQAIMLNAPRPSRQALLERRIVAHFCGVYPCDGLIAGYRERPGERLATLPHWRFRVGPVPSCNTGTGLELLFNSERRLLEKRELCRRLFAELAALAQALGAAQRRGTALEWDRLRIEAPAAGRTDVLLNRDGDRLALPVPALASSPRLLELVLPWLMGEVEGGGQRGVLLVVTNAEDLLPHR